MIDSIQTYVNIYDIIPTEGFWEEVQDNLEPKEFWLRDELIENIAEQGLKYALKINKQGGIVNGNMRYWCMRHLLEKTGNLKYMFVPVELEIFHGLAHAICLGPLTNEIVNEIIKDMINTKRLVIPSKTEFEDYEQHPTDPKKLLNYEKVRQTQYDLYPFRKKGINHLTIIQVTRDDYDRVNRTNKHADSAGRESGEDT